MRSSEGRDEAVDERVRPFGFDDMPKSKEESNEVLSEDKGAGADNEIAGCKKDDSFFFPVFPAPSPVSDE